MKRVKCWAGFILLYQWVMLVWDKAGYLLPDKRRGFSGLKWQNLSVFSLDAGKILPANASCYLLISVSRALMEAAVSGSIRAIIAATFLLFIDANMRVTVFSSILPSRAAARPGSMEL